MHEVVHNIDICDKDIFFAAQGARCANTISLYIHGGTRKSGTRIIYCKFAQLFPPCFVLINRENLATYAARRWKIYTHHFSTFVIVLRKNIAVVKSKHFVKHVVDGVTKIFNSNKFANLFSVQALTRVARLFKYLHNICFTFSELPALYIVTPWRTGLRYVA